MPGGQLVACADPDVRRATELASTAPCAEAFTDWREMLTKTPCDIVVVATPHYMLAEITAAAIERGAMFSWKSRRRASPSKSRRSATWRAYAALRCASASIIAAIGHCARLTRS